MDSRILAARSRVRTIAAAASTALLLLNFGVAYPADDDGYADPVYMTGAEVRIDRAVDGDLIAAAGRIHIDRPIAGDAILGAGSLDLLAPVGEDLRAAGGFVTVANRVHGEVMIAAGRIVFTPAADIHGHTWLAGSRVSIDGRALASMKIYGRDVAILGEVYGPLEISADHIEIGGSARIHGDIAYSSQHEIAIDPQAQIAGKVTRIATKIGVSNGSTNIPGLKPMRPLLLAGLFAAGALIYGLLPGFVRASVRMLGEAPLKSLGLGSALFFSVPPIALLLIITIIGIPIGVALAAAHAVALVAAYLVIGFYLAKKLEQLVRRKREASAWRLVFFAAALLLLAVVTSIPYAGPVVLLVALAAGLGAIVLQAFSRYGTVAPAARSRDVWPGA
jgi:cytoskeletal protein CcmA (bactofilin family)